VSWFGIRRKVEPPRADSNLPRTRLGAMREDAQRFAGLTDARVLIYWPHGLGDWAQLGSIAGLLEPSNRYAITRFGDDYVSLMDNHPTLMPLYSGVRQPGDGERQGACNFGITIDQCDGGRVELALPPPLDEAVGAFAPEALLWTDFPETEGRTPYPFHTKARNLLRALVDPQRLPSFDLSAPLRSSIDFVPSAHVMREVETRLSALAPPGSRLAIVSRTGYSAARKNWGDGSQAREFVRRLRRDDPSWRTISMDEDDLGDGAAGFRALFGDSAEPFARLYKALAARTELFVGVPAGPLHVTMARGGIPVVGLWMAHHPDWYDEPNAEAIHLVSRFVRDRGFDRRPATTSKPASLRHRTTYLDAVEIAADDVMGAAREALR